jgi:hypothetical protein
VTAHGHQVSAYGFHNRFVRRHRLFNHFADQHSGQGGTVEFVGEVETECRLKSVMIEDGGIEEAGQHRLGLRLLAGL